MAEIITLSGGIGKDQESKSIPTMATFFSLPPAGLKTWDPAFMGGLLKEHDCALSCAVVFPISEIFSQLVAQLVTISAHYSFQTHLSLRDGYGCSWGERLKKFFVNSVGGTRPSSAQPSHITP